LKKLYILDIKKKLKNFDFLSKIEFEKNSVLSLTPYSNYILDERHLDYLTFKNVVSDDLFRDKILEKHQVLENIFEKHKRYSYLIIKIAQLTNYELYLQELFTFFDEYDEVIYITDTKNPTSLNNIVTNIESAIYLYKNIKTIDIENIDYLFYQTEKIIFNFYTFFRKKNKLKVLLDKLKKEKLSFNYDNQYLLDFFTNLPKKKVTCNNIDKGFNNLEIELEALVSQYILKNYFQEIVEDLKLDLEKAKTITEVSIKPFTFLPNNSEFIKTLIFKDNNIPVVFTQHGNYLYQNMFIKYLEIIPADTNLVLNNFTNKLFKKSSFNNIQNIYSNNFNLEIKKNMSKKYDYLYILFASYPGNMNYLSDKYSLNSLDKNFLFQHHKKIIYIFGEKFSNKKFVIKLHPQMIMSGLYIPFFEIAKKYKNIRFEISEPIHSLIEKSEHIISDYFTSEFLNRNVFQKKIILINTPTTHIPKDELENMIKLFILVENLEEIEDRIKNIDKYEICQDDELIDYYSSPKEGQDIVEVVKKIYDLP